MHLTTYPNPLVHEMFPWPQLRLWQGLNTGSLSSDIVFGQLYIQENRS